MKSHMEGMLLEMSGIGTLVSSLPLLLASICRVEVLSSLAELASEGPSRNEQVSHCAEQMPEYCKPSLAAASCTICTFWLIRNLLVGDVVM